MPDKTQKNSGTDSSSYNTDLQSGAMGAAGAAGAIGGIVDIVAGFQEKKRAKQGLAKANQNLDSVLASQPSLSTPSQYYDAVKNAYDQRLLQMRTEDINRSFATTAQAAQQYGSRGLGAVMSAQQQSQDALRREALTQQQLQTDALTNLASARERETNLREVRSNRDLDYAYDQKALEEARLAQARQQIGEGVVGTIGGVAKAAVGFGSMAKGGQVQKTPGKYSHKENEMYVVDNQGDSVGIALTGGEYVIDPARAKRLKKKSKDSSLKGMRVLRKEVAQMVDQFENKA